MNFNYYIITSILCHLLFFVSMGVTHSKTGSLPEIFEVNIVTPEEPERPVEKKQLAPPERELVPPVIRRSRRPMPKKTVPETMFGKGISTDAGPDEKSAETKPPAEKSAKDKDRFEAFTSEEAGKVPEDRDGPTIVPPSVLFDQKTIEKFASKGPEPSQGLTFDTSGFRHRGYMRMLKERIESLWQYPKEAARSGLSGDLRIKFVIKRDGSLAEVTLVRTSGYRSLDEAAMQALEKAAPYWPLPDDWEGDNLEITGHFIYVYGITHVL